MRSVRLILTSLLAAFLASSFVQAQTLEQQRENVNQGVVKVLGGSVGGTYSQLNWDMSTLFDDGYVLRVLPILGKGSIKGVEDLLLLKSIDVAFLQSDVLDFMVKHKVYPNIENQLRYLTTLYNEEVHVVAKKTVNSIQDLEGKRVNFGPETSGTFMTASILFDDLGLTVEVTGESYQDAVEMLKKGEIDAFVRVAGAPVKLLESIGFDSNMHILEIPKIEGAYFEAEVTHEQYPGLMPQGTSRKTLAVAAVLAAYNWPAGHHRRAPVENLYTKLGERYKEFQQEPYHEKWKEVDFDRELPGWTRWKNYGPQS